MVTLNFSSIESKLLESIKSIDTQGAYFKKIQVATTLREIDLKVQMVRQEANERSINPSINSTREIISSFPFNKNTSKDLPVISKEYVENLLFEIEQFNNKGKIHPTTPDELDTNVQKHAQARLLLFHQVCTAYYNTRPTRQIQRGETVAQIGKGDEKNKTEGCHHAILCNFKDSFFQDLKNDLRDSMRAKDERFVIETLKELLFLGVPGKSIHDFLTGQLNEPTITDQALETLFPKSDVLIDRANRLFYLNNHTLIAEGTLNASDDAIESCRPVAINLLNECAAGRISPLQATTALGDEIARTTSSKMKNSEELVTLIANLRKQTIDTLGFLIKNSNATNFDEKKASILALREVALKALHFHGLNEFRTFKDAARALITDLDRATDQYAVDLQINPTSIEDRRKLENELHALEALSKLRKNRSYLESLEAKCKGGSLSPSENLEVFKIKVQATKDRLIQLESDLMLAHKDPKKAADFQNRIATYKTILKKIENKEALDQRETFEVEKRSIMNDFFDASCTHLPTDIDALRSQIAASSSKLEKQFNEFKQSLVSLTNVLTHPNAPISKFKTMIEETDRKMPNPQTIRERKKFLQTQKTATEMLTLNLKNYSATNIDYRIQHLFAICRSIS